MLAMMILSVAAVVSQSGEVHLSTATSRIKMQAKYHLLVKVFPYAKHSK